MCGEIVVNGETVRLPRQYVAPDSSVEFARRRYVSRGGEKLEAALGMWNISVEGKVLLDAGCSTGGFTDCLLSKGASFVHAVDVGYNQVDYKIRTNPSVALYERRNIMDIEDLDPRPHGAVADLSFRSVSGAGSHILSLTTEGWLISLIKPQFEWRNPSPDFTGVVTGNRNLKQILFPLIDRLWDEGAYVAKVMKSPLRGRKGNTEFFFLLSAHEGVPKKSVKSDIRAIIGKNR
jgi:23S rRNA (cytidine1920-2'-O)/16S rRNA (cytidine1409-2'-O)-methyltransferase